MGELRKLGDIMQELLHPTPEQLEAQRKREQSFRRGYHQGYNEALDIVFGLLRDGLDIEDIIRRTGMHEWRIADWRADQDDTMVTPPDFRRTA